MRRYRGLLLLVIVGVGAALALLGDRWRVEGGYRTVEVIIDGQAWSDLAVREGRDPTEFLAQVRDQGATSVALYEASLRQLADRGRLSYMAGADLLAMARVGTLAPPLQGLREAGGIRLEEVYVLANGPLGAWVEKALRGILGDERVRRIGDVLAVRGTVSDLTDLGLGFYPPDVTAATRAGFSPVLRPRNYHGLTPQGLAWKLAAMHAVPGPFTLVFDGADILGYERLIDEAAAGLRDAGDRYGRIEVFTAKRKQRGEDALTARMRPAVIRLFSVTPEEMATTPAPAVVDKFVRAAEERNIRLLYVRPLTQTPAGIDAIEANLDLVGSVVRGLRQHEFAVGPAPSLPDRSPSPVLLGLTAAGGLALGAIALSELASAAGSALSSTVLWGLVGAGLLVTVATAAGSGLFVLWRQLLALGVAVAGATLAVTVSLARAAGGPVRRGVAVLWLASGVASAAGVLVAGLLTGWPFMLAFRTFLGVKVAHVLPPVLAGFVLAFAGRPGDIRSTLRQIWRWLERPLRLQYAVVAVVAGVFAVMLLVRSGNFGLPVTGVEVRLRQVLEDVLVARPRTKEFLIGHPALILAAAAEALGLSPAVIPLAMIGAVGQAGLINSFSHVHTPLVLVVLRTLYALIIGSVLGSIGAVVLQAAVRRLRPSSAGPRGRAVEAAPPARLR